MMTFERLTERDLQFLRRAIDLASEARSLGRHPFGSLVVDELGEVLASGLNNAVRPAGDPTQHAEMLACAAVGKRFSEAQLARATLYTSTEPCAMCAGAIYWTGIGRVVFGLAETSLLQLTGSHPENPTLDLPCREVFARGQRRVVVVGPAIEEEAAAVHKGFWSSSTP
jgi:tRNA(Arg) A34 adenosine deaminase TadA